MGGQLPVVARLPFPRPHARRSRGNIKSAIQEWLQVEAEESGVSKVEEDLVAI